MDKPAKVILMRTTGVAVSLSADAAKLPRRIKVLNWGDNPNSHGKRVNVGPLFATCLNAETYPYRKVALDFEHNTFPGTAAYKESKEPRPVAGFGTIEARGRRGRGRVHHDVELDAGRREDGGELRRRLGGGRDRRRRQPDRGGERGPVPHRGRGRNGFRGGSAEWRRLVRAERNHQPGRRAEARRSDTERNGNGLQGIAIESAGAWRGRHGRGHSGRRREGGRKEARRGCGGTFRRREDCGRRGREADRGEGGRALRRRRRPREGRPPARAR